MREGGSCCDHARRSQAKYLILHTPLELDHDGPHQFARRALGSHARHVPVCKLWSFLGLLSCLHMTEMISASIWSAGHGRAQRSRSCWNTGRSFYLLILLYR